MNRRPRHLALAVSLLSVAIGSPLGAQSTGDGFFLGRPTGSFTLRGGWTSPQASGGVFDDATKLLTLSRGSFGGGAFGGSVEVLVTDRLAIQGGVTVMERRVGSEFRDWVDTDDQPITQRTTFQRMPISFGAKYYLTSPGRSLSRLVWIPARVTPFVTGGGGFMRHRFSQTGDFVDFETLDVFPSTLTSQGWSPMLYGSAGVQVGLTTRLALSTEARFDQSRGTLRGDFVGFDAISLSGWTGLVGLDIRF